MTSTDEHELSQNLSFNVHHNADHGDYKFTFSRVATCNTIQDFWNILNYLPDVSLFWKHNVNMKTETGKLQVKGYSIFANGITPEWEHDENRFGSEFVCKNVSLDRNVASQIWKSVAVDFARGSYNNVNGIRCMYKPATYKHDLQFKIEIWMCKDSNWNEDSLLILKSFSPFEVKLQCVCHSQDVVQENDTQ